VWEQYKRYGDWNDKRNQRELLDSLAVKWNIKKPEDWLRITNKMVVREGGSFIMYHYNGSLVKGNISLLTDLNWISIKGKLS
jgi:hypothetical protein